MRKVGTLDSRGRKRVQTINNDPSMTVQSDAHLADIQNIMRSYGAEDMKDNLDEADLDFRDVSEFTDLADALAQAKQAEVQFMKLPSKVRELYGHDVAVWLDTAHDPDKREAMHDVLVEKGWIKTEELVLAKEPQKAPEEAPKGAEEGKVTEGSE